MNRKWYNIYSMFKGRTNLSVREGFKKSDGGFYINLYLTKEEADKIRNIYYIHDYVSRTPYLVKEHMMHEIYKVLPELFEY